MSSSIRLSWAHAWAERNTGYHELMCKQSERTSLLIGPKNVSLDQKRRSHDSPYRTWAHDKTDVSFDRGSSLFIKRDVVGPYQKRGSLLMRSCAIEAIMSLFVSKVREHDKVASRSPKRGTQVWVRAKNVKTVSFDRVYRVWAYGLASVSRID